MAEVESASPENDKEFLKYLIDKQSDRISLVKKDNCKSEAWKKFGKIKLDAQLTDFACCYKCKEVLSAKGSSTSSLLRHSCSSSTQIPITQWASITAPASAIHELNKQILIGLATDLRPLHSISLKGFIHIVQTAMDFGWKYRQQDAKKLLFKPQSLKRMMPEVKEPREREIAGEIQKGLAFPNISFTFDLWTDNIEARHFLSMTCHYINDKFQLITQLLAVDEFPMMSQTTDNIRIVCNQIISRYFGDQATKIMESAYAVTDGGTNVTQVFQNRLPCLCHLLNTIMTWVFNTKKPKKPERATEKQLYDFSEECPNYNIILTQIRNVVTYFKQAKLNAQLKPKDCGTLKRAMPVRWNSQLTMLRSYQSAKSEVKKILLEKNELARVYDINESLLKEFIDFLSVFEKCTLAWSQEKVPTICSVAVWVADLRTHLEEKAEDSLDLKNLKAQGRRCLMEYFSLDDIYYIGLVFHPVFKRLNVASPHTRQAIYAKIRSMIAEETPVREPKPMEINSSESLDPPDTKRMRFMHDKYADSSDSEGENETESELDKYLAESKVARADRKNFDVMEYWRTKKDLPIMRKIAARILAIPASQTSDERVFSTTGATLSSRRTEMKGSTLSSLTFIAKNILK